jgi:predicted PurR-regulated permease PerM
MIAWCFQILRPFITPVIWGAIIAIAFYPALKKLSDLLGNRIKIAASIITVTTLLLIILPSIQMVGSFVDGMTYLNDNIHSGEIKVPPPPENLARDLFVSLAGERGNDFADVSTKTIRNVVKGILGVAIIQGLLAGMGFMVAGVPGAGVWAFLCLFLAIIQIGIAPVAIPVIIYMFYNASTLTAELLMVWLILVMLSDNFLKPILLGRGAPVPMLVIFSWFNRRIYFNGVYWPIYRRRYFIPRF